MADKPKPLKKLAFADEAEKIQPRRSSLTSIDEKTKSLRNFSMANEVSKKFDLRKTAEKLSGGASKTANYQCGLDPESYKKLKESTGLSDQELESRYEEFSTNFPEGVISYTEFRDLSSQILDPSEVEAFCRNVFRMFDSNKDANLTFDEFTIATSAKDSSPAEKLAWLFDHVYDKNKSGRVTHNELHGIIMTLLKMENISETEADEMVYDIFRDLDLNQDGLITKREFLLATTQSTILSKILSQAADEEKKKNIEKNSNLYGTKSMMAIASDELKQQKKKKEKRRSTKRKINYDPTQRRPSREIEIYGMGTKSLLLQSKI